MRVPLEKTDYEDYMISFKDSEEALKNYIKISCFLFSSRSIENQPLILLTSSIFIMNLVYKRSILGMFKF